MEFVRGIFKLIGGSDEKSQSASMNNPVSHQDNLNQANPQFNTYYYQPNNIAQHGVAPGPGYLVMNDPAQYGLPGNPASSIQPSANLALPCAASAPPVLSPPGDPTSIVQWVRSSSKNCSELKDRAVVGGYSIYGDDLWVIRSVYEGNLLPGALNIRTKDGFVAYGNVEIQVDVFEVACAPANRVQWIEDNSGKVPPNAVVGGKTSFGEKLYVGRAYESKCLSPGKIQPSHKVMYVSFGGKACPHQLYEVMCIV